MLSEHVFVPSLRPHASSPSCPSSTPTSARRSHPFWWSWSTWSRSSWRFYDSLFTQVQTIWSLKILKTLAFCRSKITNETNRQSMTFSKVKWLKLFHPLFNFTQSKSLVTSARTWQAPEQTNQGNDFWLETIFSVRWRSMHFYRLEKKAELLNLLLMSGRF